MFERRRLKWRLFGSSPSNSRPAFTVVLHSSEDHLVFDNEHRVPPLSHLKVLWIRRLDLDHQTATLIPNGICSLSYCGLPQIRVWNGRAMTATKMPPGPSFTANYGYDKMRLPSDSLTLQSVSSFSVWLRMSNFFASLWSVFGLIIHCMTREN